MWVKEFNVIRDYSVKIAALLCAFLIALASSAAFAQTISPLNAGRVARSSTVSIVITPVPPNPVRIGFVRQDSGTADPTCDKGFYRQIGTNRTDTGASFSVPADLPAGEYLLCVLGTSAPLPVPTGSAPFEVGNFGNPVINALEPLVAYPIGQGDAAKYRLFVHGSNFSPVPDENYILLKGRKIIPDCENSCTTSFLTFSLNRKPSGQEPAESVTGPLALRLYVRGTAPSDEREVTFAAVTSGVAKFLAIAVTFIILAIVTGLIARGIRVAGGQPSGRGIIAALLLDSDGQTYSLSKFQFLIWSVVAVGGYLFLAFAWSLIQGQFDLPPVPEGLPGIIGISGGTALVAAAASGARGAKGSGPTPSVGDFIVTGGRVAAERLQFFVWTIVSVVAFVLAVGASDPGVIQTLPRIPEGLLFLMGISSAGYLGGKFIRRPSPSLAAPPLAKFADQKLVITAEGRQLSEQLRIAIDRKYVPRTGTATVTGTSMVEMEFQEPEVDPPDPGFFKKVTLTVEDPLPLWQEGKHTLMIVNPDGQSTEKGFEVNAKTVLLV